MRTQVQPSPWCSVPVIWGGRERQEDSWCLLTSQATQRQAPGQCKTCLKTKWRGADERWPLASTCTSTHTLRHTCMHTGIVCVHAHGVGFRLPPHTHNVLIILTKILLVIFFHNIFTACVASPMSSTSWKPANFVLTWRGLRSPWLLWSHIQMTSLMTNSLFLGCSMTNINLWSPHSPKLPFLLIYVPEGYSNMSRVPYRNPCLCTRRHRRLTAMISPGKKLNAHNRIHIICYIVVHLVKCLLCGAKNMFYTQLIHRSIVVWMGRASNVQPRPGPQTQTARCMTLLAVSMWITWHHSHPLLQCAQ